MKGLMLGNITTMSETSKERDRLFKFLRIKQNSFRMIEESRKKMDELLKRKEDKYKQIESK
jgi:lysozyme family protein